MGKRGPKPKEFISLWTPQLAYAVGLIATDGCLSNDGRHIDFTSKDRSLVETFKKCLGLKNKIGTKTSGYNQKSCPRIEFGSVNFYKWLIKIGLSPRKSKTIAGLKIPNRYFFDFLRGSFDGDGSCYSYWDPRWKSSFMFYLTFSSASPAHIQWLRKRIKTFAKINGYISKSSKDTTLQLKYAKKEARELIQRIYYSQNLPHLERKYIKLKKILEVDEAENNK